jgi:CHASE1-domain containing sensor protein
MDSNDNAWRRILGFSPALFAALTGITVTIIAYMLVVQWVEYRIYSRFERAALDHSAVVQRGVSGVLNALASPHDFHLARVSVERYEFERFTQGKLERVPGINAVFWAPRVTATKRASVFDTARAYDPAFKIHNDSAVDDDANLYPVLYLQPPHGSEIQPGLNLASLPDIRPLL